MDEELFLFCFATLLVLVGMTRRKEGLPEKDIKEVMIGEMPNEKKKRKRREIHYFLR